MGGPAMGWALEVPGLPWTPPRKDPELGASQSVHSRAAAPAAVPRWDLARGQSRDCWPAPRRFGQHNTAPQPAQRPGDTARTWSHTLIMSATWGSAVGTVTRCLCSLPLSVPSVPSRLLCPVLSCPALLLLPPLCYCAPSHSTPLPESVVLHTAGVRKCSVGRPTCPAMQSIDRASRDHGHEHFHHHSHPFADLQSFVSQLLTLTYLLIFSLPPAPWQDNWQFAHLRWHHPGWQWWPLDWFAHTRSWLHRGTSALYPPDEQCGGTMGWTVRGQLLPLLSARGGSTINQSCLGQHWSWGMRCSTLGWSFCTIPQVHISSTSRIRRLPSVPASRQLVWAKPAIFHAPFLALIGGRPLITLVTLVDWCDTAGDGFGFGVGVRLGESQQPRPPIPECSARPFLWPHQGLPQCWSGRLPNSSSEHNCRCVLAKLFAPSPLHSCGPARPPAQRTKTKSTCPEFGAGATYQPPIQPWKSPQDPSGASVWPHSLRLIMILVMSTHEVHELHDTRWCQKARPRCHRWTHVKTSGWVTSLRTGTSSSLAGPCVLHR